MTAIEVSGALNFRDVGGLPAAGGATRRGVLYRSGNLARLTDSGRTALRELGVARIVDLRDDDEVRYEPSLIGDAQVEVVRVPMFAGSVASFFDDDLSLDDLYRALIDGSAHRLVEVARAVASAQPVLVHCTVGKDRTGVSVALILAAVGVEREAIVADYARTAAALPAERNARVLSYLRGRYPHARHLADLATASPAGAMAAVFEDLDARYGGPLDYLQAHGLADDEVAALREALVE